MNSNVRALPSTTRGLAPAKSSLFSLRHIPTSLKALEERYAEPLPTLAAEVESLTERVEEHLREMGLTWPARA